jgi:HCOMODA/2-hydroxy-3-carboxy-muconic semialdehyde decarboxylase
VGESGDRDDLFAENRRTDGLRAQDVELAEELALANRILYDRGVVDGFGHVSVRDDRDPQRFYLARNIAPALVTAADVMSFALDGTALGGDDRTPYLERFIHGSIFRARPDIGAVVHSHSAAVIPFGVVAGVTLRPLFHMSSFLRGPVPLFEIRDAAGPDNDMLVRDEMLGDALATSLGDAPTVLMRGHGSTTVGRSLPEAVFRAVYTEVNARLQAESMRMGEVTFLNDKEALRSSASNAGQIARAWELWSREVDRVPG